MSRFMIACFTSHMFFKCYYNYYMLACKYQIYYKYVLELSLICTDYCNTCVLQLFTELCVHLIDLMFFVK